MADETWSLFTLVVDEEQLHPHFKTIMAEPGYAPARWMLDEVYANCGDPYNLGTPYQFLGAFVQPIKCYGINRLQSINWYGVPRFST